MELSSHSTRRIILDGIRIFNKNVFNKLTLMLTRSGIGPYTIVYHRGRRSGLTYRTPILATFIGEIALIPLPYGEHVDWLRNILAAGGGVMFRKGKRFEASAPAVITGEAALARLPEKRRRLLQRFAVHTFLQLQLSQVV